MALEEQLLVARASGRPCAVPPGDQPGSEQAAYAVQQAISRTLGPIGGWKVGAAGPEAAPNAAPLPASVLLPSGAVLGPEFSDRLIESEIAFRLSEDLPPRAEAYGRADILAAIDACLPVIEIVQWRILEGSSASPLLKLADHLGHGALILGERMAEWQGIDFPHLRVRQEIEGGDITLRTGNPAGDMIRLIQWLANNGARWAGGLKAGQIITCGSWTGMLPVGPGAEARTSFVGFAPVSVRFHAG